MKIVVVTLIVFAFLFAFPIPLNASISFQNIIIDTGKGLLGKGVGDLDGDGDLDLIIGSRSNANVVWYQNPTWQKRLITTGTMDTDIETADIDGDGDNDIVLTLEGTTWLKNNGSGLSWTKTNIDSGPQHDVEIVDFNGDGKLDLVTRGQTEYQNNGQYVYLYTQDTNTSFTKQSRSDLPRGEGLTTADIDADGDTDVVVNNVWLENNGASFSVWPKRTYVASWHPNAFVATCDLDRDGRLDIVASPSEASSDIFEFRISYFRAPADPKSSGWTEVIIDPSVPTIQHYVGCADFDVDGDLDVVSAQMGFGGGGGDVIVYENQGNHTSFLQNTIWTRGSHSMRIADINRDGKPDLYGADWEGHEVQLFLNTAAAPPLTATPPQLATPTKTPTPTLSGTMSLTSWTYIHADNSRATRKLGLSSTDLTGDGYKDIVSGEYFYRNPGATMTGTWVRAAFPNSALDALLTVNVDNDVYGDVIAMDESGDVYWLEATTANGSSWNQTRIGSLGVVDEGISTQGYLTAQIKSGGKPEIILNVPGKLVYFEIPANPTTGNWPVITVTTAITSEPEGVAAGDVDRDGDVDIASVIGHTQTAWWRNPEIGGGSWTKYVIGTLPGEYGDRLGLADLDGDGDLDLAVTAANGLANGVYWFRSPSTPTSTWTRANIIVSASNPQYLDTFNSMDLADMDRDGDTDVVTADHRGARQMLILENSGNGTFTPHIISEGIENHLGARVFDLDGDGDLDIIGIGWDKYQDLHIWRNDSSAAGLPPTSNSLQGDINKDGTINILDYTLLSNAFGTSNTSSDINKDGIVNILDYTILSNNFGRSP